jgi:pilus assembly protein FimV
MFKRNFWPVLLLALLSPAAALALGLGDIHLKSALNAPLDAEIELVGASADDLSTLKASLAARDAFTRGGLDYPSFLGALSFVPEKTADGRNVLHVHSAQAANEPFATLLVEVDWARGHVVREYTVLIDPPVFSGAEPSAKANISAPTAGSSARSGAVEPHPAVTSPADNASATAAPAAPTAASAPTAAPAAPTTSAAPAGKPSAPHAAASRYTVRAGDTLSGVASQAYPGADRQMRARELVAIYRGNPTAFAGNMNLLLAGSHLDMPGESELEAISPGEASAEVRRQYDAWAGAHGAGAAHGAGGEQANAQLHLVPPQESARAPASAAPAAPASRTTPAATAAAAAAAANAAALTQRVQDLQNQLAESQRLLQLRNADLAAMQARVAQSAANTATAPSTAPAAAAKPAAPAAAPATPAPAASAPSVSAPAPAAPSAAAPIQNLTPPAAAPPATPPAATAPAATAPAETPPAAAPTVVKPVNAPPATSGESGNSLLDLIEQYWYVPAALLAVLIILVVLRFVRARQEDEFDRSLGRLQPGYESSASDALRASDTVPVRTLPAAGGETSYRVEESGPHEQPIFEQAPDATLSGATGQHVAIDDTVTGERPVALDQGDPLAEADFHMAYGLYDQAADLVQIAISREPNRRELKLKLLEVFFVWGNKDRFLQTARELAGSRAQALAGEWEKMVIMGRQIAPEDPLFAHAGTLTGAASGGVDLNLEGGQNRVDFDLLGEPSVRGGTAQKGAGVDLDLGSALGDDVTGEVNKVGDNGVDFVLDDPERGNDATGSTREMPGAPGGVTRELPGLPAGAGTAAAKEYTATMRIAGSPSVDPEAPTVEQQQLRGGEGGTIRQKISAAGRTGASTPDQTAELALDDLGLDLGALEGVADETGIGSGPDAAPTQLSNLDEDTRELLARARAEHAQGDATQRAPSGDGPTDSGTWLFTDTDFAEGMAREADRAAGAEGAAPTQLITQISPQPPLTPDSSSTTANLVALESAELDLDLGSGAETSSVNGVDLDVGTPSISEGTFVQTQKIAAGEMALPELEPATMSEVGTKLDLARAYMDMGDPEGARSILAEVLSEGSVSQKQEARRLMDTLPG